MFAGLKKLADEVVVQYQRRREYSVHSMREYLDENGEDPETPRAVASAPGFRERNGDGNNEPVKIEWEGADGYIRTGSGRRVSTPWGVFVATTCHVLDRNLQLKVFDEHKGTEDTPEIILLGTKDFRDIDTPLELPVLVKEDLLKKSNYSVSELPDISGFPVGLPAVPYDHEKDYHHLSFCGSTSGSHSVPEDFNSLFDCRSGDSGSALIRPTMTEDGPAFVLTHIVFGLEGKDHRKTIAWEIVPLYNDGRFKGYNARAVEFSKEEGKDGKEIVLYGPAESRRHIPPPPYFLLPWLLGRGWRRFSGHRK